MRHFPLVTTVAQITMTGPPEHKRRRFQYNLRSLFILTTLVAIACSWYAVEMQKAAKRRVRLKFNGDPAVCVLDGIDRMKQDEGCNSQHLSRRSC